METLNVGKNIFGNRVFVLKLGRLGHVFGNRCKDESKEGRKEF